MLNKIYHADFTEAVQPRRFDKMLNLVMSCHGKIKGSLDCQKKRSDKGGWHYQQPLPFKKGD